MVEDDPLIALLLEDMLLNLGAVQTGSARTVEDGLNMLRGNDADAAILDVNLHGRSSKPIAEALTAAGVPVIYATGYGASAVAGPADDAIVLEKPFTQTDVAQALLSAMARRSGSAV